MQPGSRQRSEAEGLLRACARALFISCDSIGAFLGRATPGQLAACTSLLEDELSHRERAKRERLLRQAGFPVPETLEGFDWPNVRLPDGWGADEMRGLSFVDAAEDLVFFGKTGRGKSHASIGLGMAAVAAGTPVRSYQTARLVLALGKAKRDGTLDRVLADVAKARLVILDEFGHVPFDVDGARLPCQVISDSYECRSIVFTTNVEFSRWGTVLADDKPAAAIVDRVARHGRLVEFGGPSHRLENSLMLGKGGE